MGKRDETRELKKSFIKELCLELSGEMMISCPLYTLQLGKNVSFLFFYQKFVMCLVLLQP